jgi:hypothetical protein
MDTADVQRSAVYAVAAVSRTADVIEFARPSANYALEAVSFSRDSFNGLLTAYSTDAELLDQRTSPVTLANQQLWPGRLPDWVEDAWDQLKQALLAEDDDWIVWVDWYEERLKGNTPRQDIEIDIATIPEKIWRSDPGTVNAHIRELVKQHGISPPEIRPASRFSLELEALTQAELSTIGARVALRVLPLIEFHEHHFLLVLRAICSAWTAARYELPIGHRTHADSVYADLLHSPLDLASNIGDALFASAFAAGLPAAVPHVVKGIEALREATFHKNGKVAEAVFDLCLSQDLNDLRGADVASVAELPIWLGDAPPEPATRRWNSLKRDLLAPDNMLEVSNVLDLGNVLNVGKGWEVWVDWYEDRIAGTGRSKAHNFAYIQVPDELWPQGAESVNTWIRNRIYEADGLIPPTKTDDPRQPVLSDPAPIEGAPNPLGIVARPDGRIGAEAGPLATPVLPPAIAPEDHERSLVACRVWAEQLRAIAAAPTFQGRRDYTEILFEYVTWLPAAPGTGNILLADGEARILNDLFTAEEAILPTVFAARLKVLLQDHIALRAFYPELERHYVAIKTGRRTRPLKRDAVDAIKQIIHEHTPDVFDNSVGAAMDEVGKPAPHVEAPRPEDTPSPDGTQPKPPKDPVADIDPQKTWDFSFATAANRIWVFILKGKDLSEGVDGWRKTYEQMKPHIGDIIEWLKAFWPGDGGGGPPMPPTITI